MMPARRGVSTVLLTEYGISAEISEPLVSLLQEDLTERISENRKYLCLGCVQRMWGRSSISSFFKMESDGWVAGASWTGLVWKMPQMSKIAELYREWLHVKCLSVTACAFLIAQVCRGLLFSFFSLPSVYSVTSYHYRKLGIINDIRWGKMPLSSSEENLISSSA